LALHAPPTKRRDQALELFIAHDQRLDCCQHSFAAASASSFGSTSSTGPVSSSGFSLVVAIEFHFSDHEIIYKCRFA
jgi:hypothetical protein